MKYSVDTYRLYSGEERFAFSIRIKVTMKEKVDGDILEKSVNEAIVRYPYFSVKTELDENGGYFLKYNPKKVKVFPVESKVRMLCSEEVNEHLLFVEYEGVDIYFNISHNLCGGRGASQWVMTNVYQYVKNKYNAEPYAPEIRKPGEDFLPGETDEPTFDNLSKEPPTYLSVSKNPTILAGDYMQALGDPTKYSPIYYVYKFKQKDVIDYAKANNASVISLFMVTTAKALDKILPETDKVIGGETAHSASADLGFPNNYHDLLSHVYLDYDREMLKWDMKELGKFTRGEIKAQIDPTVTSYQLKQIFDLYDGIDNETGLENKKKYMKEQNVFSGPNARHGTYIVNYTGKTEWGEVADYVDSYVIIVEGHMLLEVTAMADKIFISVMQLLNTDKYINAHNDVLKELKIPFQIEGPFPKHISKHSLKEN